MFSYVDNMFSIIVFSSFSDSPVTQKFRHGLMALLYNIYNNLDELNLMSKPIKTREKSKQTIKRKFSQTIFWWDAFQQLCK